MNKYQEALNSIRYASDRQYLIKETDLECIEELVDDQEKLKTIIKKYELELGNLKEYTQGHSLLNSLICDLNKLIIDSTHNELDDIFADSLEALERLKIKK